MQVQFHGEKGFDASEHEAGVTRGFYSAVARELQKKQHNGATPLWLAIASTDGSDEMLLSPGGLHPQPFPFGGVVSPPAEVLGRFRMVGRLVAVAMRDGFKVALPLGVAFLALAQVLS